MDTPGLRKRVRAAGRPLPHPPLPIPADVQDTLITILSEKTLPIHVLVFHKVGGIGKTTLSRMLEAALTDAGRWPSQWGEPGWPTDWILPVRIDLARSAGTDLEQIVLTIRAALTRVGRPLPAFDLALRRYWEGNHPGAPLEEYLHRGGLGSRFGQALPQQMKSALADVAQALMLPGSIGSAAGQATSALIARCANAARPCARWRGVPGWRTGRRPNPT